MSIRILIAFLAMTWVACWAVAAPSVTFSYGGVSNGNRLLNVLVTPDSESFVPNTSVAVELAFVISPGNVVGATLNSSFWNVTGVNPGNNPFTQAVTNGIFLDTANDLIFVAAGSELFTTAVATPLMTIEYAGTQSAFGLTMGGQTLLPGTPNQYMGSRIAQNGVNYNGLQASIEPVPPCIFGDFSCSGSVGNDDLTLLLDNWGETVPPTPGGWDGTPPTAPAVGNDELTLLLDNWGDVFNPAAFSASVPEPATSLSALAAAAILLTSPANRRRH